MPLVSGTRTSEFQCNFRFRAILNPLVSSPIGLCFSGLTSGPVSFLSVHIVAASPWVAETPPYVCIAGRISYPSANIQFQCRPGSAGTCWELWSPSRVQFFYLFIISSWQTLVARSSVNQNRAHRNSLCRDRRQAPNSFKVPPKSRSFQSDWRGPVQ